MRLYRRGAKRTLNAGLFFPQKPTARLASGGVGSNGGSWGDQRMPVGGRAPPRLEPEPVLDVLPPWLDVEDAEEPVPLEPF